MCLIKHWHCMTSVDWISDTCSRLEECTELQSLLKCLKYILLVTSDIVWVSKLFPPKHNTTWRNTPVCNLSGTNYLNYSMTSWAIKMTLHPKKPFWLVWEAPLRLAGGCIRVVRLLRQHHLPASATWPDITAVVLDWLIYPHGPSARADAGFDVVPASGRFRLARHLQWCRVITLKVLQLPKSWTAGLRHMSAHWAMPDFDAMMPVNGGI